MKVTTTKIEGRQFIEIRAGNKGGGDAIHREICKWPGWRRIGSSGDESIFRAPLYAHTALPLIKKGFMDDISIDEVQAAKDILSGQWESFKIPGRELMPHQSAAVAALRLFDYKALLNDDMGLGKTTVALAAFLEVSSRLLVVCPPTIVEKWAREIRDCLGESTYIYKIQGTKKKRGFEIDGMCEFLQREEAPHAVAIIPYSLARWKITKNSVNCPLTASQRETLREWVKDQMVVLDESHYIKNPKSQRSDFVHQNLKTQSAFRIAMTGTPIRNEITDIWSQAEFVRPGCWTSYSNFVNRYTQQKPIRLPGKKKVFMKNLGTKNIPELNSILNTFQICRHKEEVLDLPPKIRTVTPLELDEPTRRTYEAMKDFALIRLLELDNETPMFEPKARSGLEAALRCEQIAQGFIGGVPEDYASVITPILASHAERIPGREGEFMFPSSTKVKWFLETIEDLWAQGNRPVVFFNYNGPAYWFKDHFDDYFKDIRIVDGAMKAEDRDKAFELFEGRHLDALFIQVKLAEGFDLTSSQDVIFYGRDLSPAINAQAEDRVHRIGQKGTVNIQIPLVDGTIESRIHKSLDRKKDLADQVTKTLTIEELRNML